MKALKVILSGLLAVLASAAYAQTYPQGLVNKTIAVIGNEMITMSQLEQELQMQRMQAGFYSDKNMRCEMLERLLEAKLFLMQARIDSLEVSNDMVDSELNNRVDQIRSQLGGDEQVEEYFGKPLYKLRQEWRKSLEESSLTQQMQSDIASKVPDLTPHDVKEYMEARSASIRTAKLRPWP